MTNPNDAPEVAEPDAWQRKQRYSNIPGGVPQWQFCSKIEATGHFERQPGYEYRPLYAHPPQPDALAELNAFIAGVEETKRPAILWEDCDFVIREGDTWFTDMQVGKDAHVKGYVIRPVEDTKADAPTNYQIDVNAWLVDCFGQEVADDKTERNHRFLEEANELAQAAGCTASEAHQIVDWVFGQTKGEVRGEIGDVMNTLAALATAHEIDMMTAAADKMVKCWAKIEKTRAKHANKPKFVAKADALVEENARLRGSIRCIEVEASRPTGRLVHLRRVIALHARAALATKGDTLGGEGKS